jgi:hypothetical protein
MMELHRPRTNARRDDEVREKVTDSRHTKAAAKAQPGALNRFPLVARLQKRFGTGFSRMRIFHIGSAM